LAYGTVMIELLTSLLVIITAIYAFLTFRILQANRASVTLMTSQIEASTRPYVTISLVRERGGFYSFEVSNHGRSGARQLRLTCEPEIKPVGAAGSVLQVGKPTDATGLFRHPLTYLAPTQTIRVLFGHYSGIRASYPGLIFKITLTYKGVGQSYSDAAELSLKPTDETSHLSEYDIGQELHDIRKAVEKIGDNIKA
jgi:hypothetical protein